MLCLLSQHYLLNNLSLLYGMKWQFYQMHIYIINILVTLFCSYFLCSLHLESNLFLFLYFENISLVCHLLLHFEYGFICFQLIANSD